MNNRRHVEETEAMEKRSPKSARGCSIVNIKCLS